MRDPICATLVPKSAPPATMYNSLGVVGIDFVDHVLLGTHNVEYGHREESTVFWCSSGTEFKMDPER